ncbi:MAG: hypothetical protein JO327_10240 [Nitrososphaeraceae archaeon]|nr:hypothetical protein [Nitrososphaeraceae archaeon]MBV9668495.1 hypothetical protein [Nitrososphaeraceae archaeon]
MIKNQAVRIATTIPIIRVILGSSNPPLTIPVNLYLCKPSIFEIMFDHAEKFYNNIS